MPKLNKNFIKFKMSDQWNNLLILIYLTSCLIGLSNCEKNMRLEILPVQEIQRKPVGKSLMLTCRPMVPDTNLVTDLQWRDNYNNTILPKFGGQKSPSMYTETLPGENLALFIPKLTEEMAGRYYCSASYANTEILETSVQIETYVAITWTDAPENQFPIQATDYTVKCQVKANPPPTVDWLRNGDPIKTSERYVVETYGLLIRDVQKSDAGTYTCRASVMQTGELVERNIRVEVYVKPEIVVLPAELEAVDEQPFSAYCNATGTPIPEISWIKDQTQQNVATADRFSVDPKSGLVQVSRINQEDHGTYTCIARNAAGVADQKTKLTVLISPKIDEFYNSSGILTKETAITCRAKGRPAPEITFSRWGSEEEFVEGAQPYDDRIILEQHFDHERGESSGTLRISKLLRTDDGLYHCIARNRGNTAFRTGHITVEYPPTFDTIKDLPPVFSWEERKANLSCLAMGIPNATIEWRWNGRLINELYDKNLVIVGNGPKSDLLVTPVSRNYYSVYKCLATNVHGKAEIDMQLKEARLPEPVPDARPKVVTATTMTFEIIAPPTERGLPVLAYSVQYREELQPDWARASNRSWSPDSPYIVENLRPQTTYVFRFAARNQVGLGAWHPIRPQSTPRRSEPEQPKTLHQSINEDGDEPIVISSYSDHFELRWNVPADNGEPIDFYQVRFCPGMKINGEWTEIEKECRTHDVIETTTFEMSHLASNTYYRIELKAHNAIGFSTNAVLYMKTSRGIDVIPAPEKQVLNSATIVGIAIGGVLILLLVIDFVCCIFLRMGVLASMCRKAKRSPSEIDDEAKLGSLYGWRFPLPYCSGQMVKEPPPSPLPLPPPVKLGGSPMASPLEEKEPLNTPPGSIKKNNSSVEFDGRFVHSRSGDIIGKNSAV